MFLLKDMDQNTWEAMYEVVPAPLSEASSFALLEKIYMYIMFAYMQISFSMYIPTTSSVQTLWHLRKIFIDIKRK